MALGASFLCKLYVINMHFMRLWAQGCNSMDIFLVPVSGPEPCPSPFWSFETYLNLQCPSTEFGPELGPVSCLVTCPKLTMSIELTPSYSQCIYLSYHRPVHVVINDHSEGEGACSRGTHVKNARSILALYLCILALCHLISPLRVTFACA